MAGPLSLSSTVEVFPCPTCHETINTSHRQCPHCSTPLDSLIRPPHKPQEPPPAASVRPASDASYLKLMSWAVGSFFLIMNPTPAPESAPQS
jgi:predicted amidophosphoribosyltransferase